MCVDYSLIALELLHTGLMVAFGYVLRWLAK